MELILAILIGCVCLARWTKEQFHNVRAARCNAIWEKTRIDPETSIKIGKLLADKVSRKRCFHIIDADMEYILGENWGSRFDSYGSQYIFEHCLGRFGTFPDYLLHDLENIVYYLMLANEGQSPYKFGLHNIGGFSTNEAHDIIKRTCIVIERLMKSKHPDLEHELDMFIWNTGNREIIEFRYQVDYLQINDARRLEV